MVNEGDCVKCEDTCIVVNEVIKKGEKCIITTCVKDCVFHNKKICCNDCLQTFNNGSKYKVGQVV